MVQPLGPEADAPPSPPRTPCVGVTTAVGVAVTTGAAVMAGAVVLAGAAVEEVTGSPRRGSASQAMPSSGPWSSSSRFGSKGSESNTACASSW